MALVPCPDCGRDVATEAPACPSCSRPMTAAAAPVAPPVIDRPPVMRDPSPSVHHPRQASRPPIISRYVMAWVVVLVGGAWGLIAYWPTTERPSLTGPALAPTPRPTASTLPGPTPTPIESHAKQKARELEATKATVAAAKVQARNKEEDAKFQAYNAADARQDLKVVRSSWKKGGFDTVAIWSVTIRNLNKAASFADITYSTSYSGESGTMLDSKTGVIYDVLKPGQTRTFEVKEGFIHGQVSRAGFQLTGASRRAP